MRFDRSDKNRLGILMPMEQAIDVRLERLIKDVDNLSSRIQRLEDLVYDSETEEKSLPWWN